MTSRVSNRTAPGSIYRLGCLIFVLAMVAGFGGAVIYSFLSEVAQLRAGMAMGSTLIVMYELTMSAVLGVIGAAAGVLCLVIEYVVVDILKRPKSRAIFIVQEWCVWGLIIGLLLALFGGVMMTRPWYHQLEKAGYIKCENNLFLLTRSFTQSAWVQNESWCHDPALYRILVKQSGPIGVKRASRYLEKTYLNR